MFTAFKSMIVFPLIFTSVEIIASSLPSGSASCEVDKVCGIGVGYREQKPTPGRRAFQSRLS
jgi:hypothetical protein